MAHYGYPRFEVSYYSQRINAGAFQTFETRHEAIGCIARGMREGWIERPTITYEEDYGF